MMAKRLEQVARAEAVCAIRRVLPKRGGQHETCEICVAGGSDDVASPGCNQDRAAGDLPQANEGAKPTAAADHNDPVASAMSAAPASISQGATIVAGAGRRLDEDPARGNERLDLHAGQPDDTWPGPDVHGCQRREMGRRRGSARRTRRRTRSASCTCSKAVRTRATPDPYATAPTAENDWINTGPHLMIVGSKEVLAGHPSGRSRTRRCLT